MQEVGKYLLLVDEALSEARSAAADAEWEGDSRSTVFRRKVEELENAKREGQVWIPLF